MRHLGGLSTASEMAHSSEPVAAVDQIVFTFLGELRHHVLSGEV